MSDESQPTAAKVSWSGTEYLPLADGKYDVIILGTGLKESILSGLLSSKGMKVLHLDRNSYYGGECASLNLTNLYKKFCKGEEPPQQFFDLLGNNRDYNVDLVPKFILANGNLVKVLVKTDVTRYMDFKLIDGSYVYKKGSAIAKVPANEAEAIKTGLLGLLQKNWLRGFLKYIAKYDQANPKTWDGMDFTKSTMKQLYDKMWLDETAQEFLGHAMALEPDDSYLSRPASECVGKLRLYAESLDRYGKSPFIYPIYGLGNLPEGFSRLCAIHGGIFILNKGVDEVLYNADGTAAGVRSGSGAEAEVALAPIIIGDPSYFPKDKVKQVGSVIRSICLLSKPVKGIEGDSGQIIIPQNQLGRKSDIYVSVMGNSHKVVAPGKYCAIVSTTVETAKPADEVKPGLDLLPADGKITQFDNVVPTYVPLEDGVKSRVFITSSYDASSHFEGTTEEVLVMYERITGEKLDLTAKAEVEGL